MDTRKTVKNTMETNSSQQTSRANQAEVMPSEIQIEHRDKSSCTEKDT